MSNRESPLYWSIPCGTWFGTDVRISVWFPIVVLVACLRLKDVQLGLAVSGLLFVSVLLHEFGHVVAARRSGGFGHEILVWPLGGLAFVHPGPTLMSQLLTPAAGPLANLILCVISAPAVWRMPDAAAVLNPLFVPLAELSSVHLGADLLVLLFWTNWVLLLVNLIPVYPLDGGRLLQVVLSRRFGGETATEAYLRVGFIVAALALVLGLIFNSIWVVFIGAMVLVLNMQETMQLRTSEGYDDSFMGYDFSQGYTSLERSAQASRPERRPGLIRRWRERRRAERQRLLEAQAIEVDQQLDALLDKVHHHGIQSLTDGERRLLDRASARYRDKGKPEV